MFAHISQVVTPEKAILPCEMGPARDFSPRANFSVSRRLRLTRSQFSGVRGTHIKCPPLLRPSQGKLGSAGKTLSSAVGRLASRAYRFDDRGGEKRIGNQTSDVAVVETLAFGDLPRVSRTA